MDKGKFEKNATALLYKSTNCYKSQNSIIFSLYLCTINTISIKK